MSFVLLTYNQEQFIGAAVEAALAQRYEPLEIIISDDCSSDATFRIASQLAEDYRGPHKVTVRRNETNLGLATHISIVAADVSGELLVAAAGDDISYPNRACRIVEQWLENGRESGSIFSLIHTLGPDGHIASHPGLEATLKSRLADRNEEIARTLCTGTLGCAHAWTRDVFEVFGGLDPGLLHEDITIPLRSLMLGSVTFIQEELVLYRLNENSLSKIGYRSVGERQKKMKKYWAGRLANYRQFDVDVQIAEERRLVASDDAAWLKRIVQRERALAALNHVFFGSGFAARLKAIMHASEDVPIARKAKLFLIACFPWLYMFKAPRFGSRRSRRDSPARSA